MMAGNLFEQIFDLISETVLAVDHRGEVVYMNPKAAADYFPAGMPPGTTLHSIIRNADDSPIPIIDEKITDGQYRLRDGFGNERDVLFSRALHQEAEPGDLTYFLIRDITVLKKTEHLLGFLNSATEELSHARDTKTALDKISTLIVPQFATWFSIDMVNNGKLEEVILTHEDPEMVQWARKYRAAYPTDLSSETGTARVIRTGMTNWIPVITKEMIAAAVVTPQQMDLIRKMNLESIITVAIFIKGTVRGAIHFVSSAKDKHYDQADVQFAQHFANHVGLALENVRLNEAANQEIENIKLTETKLKLAQTHLNSALLSGLVGTWVLDLKNKLFFADQAVAAMFGQPFIPEGCDPEIYDRLILPPFQEGVKLNRTKAIDSNQLYEMEYQARSSSGLKWIFARGKVETDTDAKPRYFTGVMIDITERKRAELLQKENEKLFQFLADAVPHKIWISAPDGKATYYNKGWYDYSGVTGLDNLKLVVWDMLHPKDRERALIEFPRVIETGENMVTEQRLRRYDGQYRWHLTRLSPHKDEGGKILLWVGTCTDIHEQKENEHRKDEFLAIASHELRTPLTNIKAYNQLLAVSPPGAVIEEFIQQSAKSIYRLERLISDLLDVTKLNAGKIGYQVQSFNFKDMLLDSIGNLKYNSSHEILLTMEQDVQFSGDRMRLEQVMNNLLSNAIKYSPNADKVLVACTVEKGNIIVAVQDFGIGIAAENLAKLFDRYYRIDNAGARFEGLGLGLFISSEILKYHKGSFWIDSEPDRGSTFYFRLPMAVEDFVPLSVEKTAYYYRDEHLMIRYNSGSKRLEVDWIGYQDLASVKHGCLLMLEYVKLHSVDRIVNDNRNVYGTWSEAAEWVGNIWFPLMEKAGLRYFAHILAVNAFGALSAKKSIDIMAGIITTQYFTDDASAIKWIESLP